MRLKNQFYGLTGLESGGLAACVLPIGNRLTTWPVRKCTYKTEVHAGVVKPKFVAFDLKEAEGT